MKLFLHFHLNLIALSFVSSETPLRSSPPSSSKRAAPNAFLRTDAQTLTSERVLRSLRKRLVSRRRNSSSLKLKRLWFRPTSRATALPIDTPPSATSFRRTQLNLVFPHSVYREYRRWTLRFSFVNGRDLLAVRPFSEA